MSEHTQYYRFCRVSYWNHGSASSPDEEWTDCKVTPLGIYTLGEQSFENTDQGRHARDNLVRFLDRAYECGRSDAKREIREVLGVKEPRS